MIISMKFMSEMCIYIYIYIYICKCLQSDDSYEVMSTLCICMCYVDFLPKQMRVIYCVMKKKLYAYMYISIDLWGGPSRFQPDNTILDTLLLVDCLCLILNLIEKS